MNQAQAFTLRGLGPTGTVLLDYDLGKGLFKDNSNRYHFGIPPIVWPLLAASANSFVWTCVEGVWQMGIPVESHTVVGGAAAALQIVVCPGSVALGSGTNQLTAAFDLTITAPASRRGARIASPTPMNPGDSLGIVLTGTLTGLVGVVTIPLERIG